MLVPNWKMFGLISKTLGLFRSVQFQAKCYIRMDPWLPRASAEHTQVERAICWSGAEPSTLICAQSPLSAPRHTHHSRIKPDGQASKARGVWRTSDVTRLCALTARPNLVSKTETCFLYGFLLLLKNATLHPRVRRCVLQGKYINFHSKYTWIESAVRDWKLSRARETGYAKSKFRPFPYSLRDIEARMA